MREYGAAIAPHLAPRGEPAIPPADPEADCCIPPKAGLWSRAGALRPLSGILECSCDGRNGALSGHKFDQVRNDTKIGIGTHVVGVQNLLCASLLALPSRADLTQVEVDRPTPFAQRSAQRPQPAYLAAKCQRSGFLLFVRPQTSVGPCSR